MDREGRAGAGARRDVKGVVGVGQGGCASSILTTGLKEALLARTPFWQRYIIMFTSGLRAPAYKAKGLTHMDASSFRQHCFLPSFQTGGQTAGLTLA